MPSKNREPQTRNERRAKGRDKKNKKAAAPDKAPLRESPGLTYHQLETMNPSKPAKAEAVDKVFECEFRTELSALLDGILGIQPRPDQQPTPTNAPAATTEELRSGFDFEKIEDRPEQAAIRKAAMRQVGCLIEATRLIFDGFHVSTTEAAIRAAEDTFDWYPDLWLAEAIIADDQASALLDFIEDVGGRIYELQLVAGSLEPEYELEHSIALGLIDEATANQIKTSAAAEVERINLRRRLNEALAATEKGDVDVAVTGLINEAKETAEAEKRRRATLRKKLARGLQERRQREGRRFSKSQEHGDEELIQFILQNRGDLAAISKNLPVALREQVQILLADEQRKTPILNLIRGLTDAAQRRWSEIQVRLSSGTDRPVEAIVKNLHVIQSLRDILAEIRRLDAHLQTLDRGVKPKSKADYGSSIWKRTSNWSQPDTLDQAATWEEVA